MRDRLYLISFVLLFSLLLPNPVSAQGTGEFVRTSISLPSDRTADAIAYGPDGRLFVLTNSQDSILAIGPQGLNGTESVIDLSGPALSNQASSQISRATFDPNSGRLLVTRSNFASNDGSIFSIDTSTGASELLFSGAEISSVSDIAVRSTGEIFVSTFGFSGTGGVFLIEGDSSSGAVSATSVVAGLDGATGLFFGFDDNLIFQNGNDGRSVGAGGDGSGDFTAEISLLEIAETPAGLAFNTPPTSLIASTTGEADFIIDSEGDFFTTGTLGLYQLEDDSTGLTGEETLLLEDLNLDFSSDLAFLPGAAAFDPNVTIQPGENSPVLSLVADSSSLQIISLSLNVSAVPEPSALLPFGMLSVWSLVRRRRS